MAGRDRLAAMRAQQQGPGRYDNAPTYPPQQSGGYQSRRPNPYAQQDDNVNRYEMSNTTTNYQAATGGGGGGEQDFYDEISSIQDSIRSFNDNVARISDLHSRSLNNMDEQAASRNNSQLDNLVESTSELSNQLKNRIKALERQRGTGRDANAKKQQTGVVKQKFMEAIQNYQVVERQYRDRYKQRMERQFKIVKPDATPDEVRAVVNDEQGGRVFTQALMSSNYTESRAAYREVQERHEDIKRIERTLTELAQLFNDMSILVEQQDEQITAIEATTGTVEKDTEAGLQYTEKAVVSARSARKKRWICFIIIVVILVIIAIVLAIKFAGNKN